MKRIALWALLIFAVWWVDPGPRLGGRPGPRIGRALTHAASSLSAFASDTSAREVNPMSLSAEFDTAADRRAYALVAAGAAALSYDHARAFFLPFMGTVGASVTPLLLDAVVFWLASANVRQARAGRPLPMLRAGAYALLGADRDRQRAGRRDRGGAGVPGAARRAVRVPGRGPDPAGAVPSPRRARR